MICMCLSVLINYIKFQSKFMQQIFCNIWAYIICSRRVNYGNLTHVNISVVLQDDNKAILLVSLDRSDKNYYACDAGCLDTPVQLG
jgi:Uncharacterized conserved protein (DUF2152)